MPRKTEPIIWFPLCRACTVLTPIGTLKFQIRAPLEGHQAPLVAHEKGREPTLNCVRDPLNPALVCLSMRPYLGFPPSFFLSASINTLGCCGFAAEVVPVSGRS